MSREVIITGAAGQLGKALVASKPPGWQVIEVTREELDLADTVAVRQFVAAQAPELVINSGAYVAVDRAENEEDLALAVNAKAVGAIADGLREAGGRLVQISTDFVFDGRASQPIPPNTPLAPISAYGRTKAEGERAAGNDATVIRAGWIYAAGGANFVHTILRLMRERDEVRVVADQIGAPTWAGGLARAVWGLARLDQPGVWHWSDAGVASWYDFAVAIEEEARARGLLAHPCTIVPIATSDYPTPARRPAFSLLDSSATRAALGLPPVHWRENLRRMIDEVRDDSVVSY